MNEAIGLLTNTVTRLISVYAACLLLKRPIPTTMNLKRLQSEFLLFQDVCKMCWTCLSRPLFSISEMSSGLSCLLRHATVSRQRAVGLLAPVILCIA